MKYLNNTLFKTIHICMVSLFFVYQSLGQETSSPGYINGNFQIGAQYYAEDEQNESQVIDQQIGFNSFANIIYTKGKFSTGVRFESYEPVFLGYIASGAPYDGSGIGYRFAKYNDDDLTITLGNFYEQFVQA